MIFYLFEFAMLTVSEIRALVAAKAKSTTPTSTRIPRIAQREGYKSVIPASPTPTIAPIVT